MRKTRIVFELMKNYRFNSVFIKNMMIIITLILPLVAINIITYTNFSKALREQADETNAAIASKVYLNLEDLFYQTDKLSTSIAANEGFGDFLKSEFKEPLVYSSTSVIRKTIVNINSLMNVNRYIDSIYVYSARSKYIVTSDGYGGKISEFVDNGWLQDVSNKETVRFKVLPRRVISNQPYKYLSIICSSPIYGSYVNGYIVVNIPIEVITNIVSSVSKQWYEGFAITDVDGIVMYDINDETIGKNFFEEYSVKRDLFKDDGKKVISNNQLHMISKMDFGRYNWSTYSSVSYKQYKMGLDIVRNRLILFVLGTILVAMLFCFLISYRMYLPIKNIVLAINTPGENSNRVPTEDEIQYILSNINQGYDYRLQLERELENRITMLRQSQTLALQAQINPHFLYNTLDTIKWKILRNGDNDAAEMISVLAELLREGIGDNGSFTSVAKELEHIKKYILLQKIRYEEKIDVVYDIDNGVLNSKVIKVLLQPFVENSINHGIRARQKKVLIKISCKRENDCLIFTVEDNGAGIDKERLKELNRQLDYSEAFIDNIHIGINNSNRRIKLVFGNEYGIKVQSVYGEMTLVTIKIPFVK